MRLKIIIKSSALSYLLYYYYYLSELIKTNEIIRINLSSISSRFVTYTGAQNGALHIIIRNQSIRILK